MRALTRGPQVEFLGATDAQRSPTGKCPLPVTIAPTALLAPLIVSSK
jgi:hypothetical protein